MSNSNSIKNDKRLNNLKYLAEEMVQILIEQKRKEAEEKMNKETVFYDIDIKSYKHKSQVFYNRNHHKMLTNFSLNKPNEDNNKSNKSIMRRKNKEITAQNDIDYLKNKISFHLNNKNPENINDNNVIDEKNLEGNKSKINLNFGEDKVSEKDEENEEEKFEEEKMLDENMVNPDEEFLEYESDEVPNERESIDNNYEIFYMGPERINTKEREELSTKNEGEYVNKEFKPITPNYKNNKGRNLFEKGMKMLYLKNNKIKKTKEIIENKNKGLFDVKNFMIKNNINKNKQNKNTKTVSKQKENHIPLQYKAGEMYRYHLTQIEFNKRSNIIKKRMKENEEMKQAKKQSNKIKKISQKSWNDFVNKEKVWKKNNKINREESLKNNYEQKIYDRPKINRSSIIMLEQKKGKEKEKNKFNIVNTKARNNFNIYTKLYEDKEIYDDKLKLKIHNSTPTFVPKIHKNRTQKSLKTLNDIIFTKNENKISKTTNNKQRIKSNNSNNKRNISFDNKNKLKKKEITLKDESFSPKLISSLSTKEIKQPKVNHMNNKRNNNTKKMIEYELDINNSNFNKKIDKPTVDKNDINSLIQKLGEKASQKIAQNKINFIRKNSIKKDIKNNTEITDKKIITPNEENNNDNENMEEKNKRKTRKKNLELDDDRKFLYNLNIRDNTSNSLKQFVVLTSKKYIDFFK